jgi:alkaline phosphatase
MRNRKNGVRLAGALVASVIALALVAPAGAGANGTATPTNIILFIGDSMGSEQVEIGRRVKGSPLLIDSIPWGATGTLNTDSLEGVTDSAAGATALATGYETLNGWVAMTPPLPGTPRETVLERAEDRSKSSGLFSTGDLPDATPGAFAAHVSDRGEDEEVAEQMHGQDIEFLLGGRAGGAVAPLEGHDDVTYAKNLRALQQAAAAYDDGDQQIYSLMGSQTLAYAIDREEEGAVGKHPTIAQGTLAALDILEEDPDGFFLMVEAGQIDWAGHSRDGAWTAAEMIAFDRAIKAAYDWAAGRTDTLIIVTADHECGGLEVGNSLDVAGMRRQTASVEWIWGAIKKDPTATNVRAKMATYTGISDLSTAEVNLIRSNKEMGISDVLAARWNVTWGWDGTDEGEHTDTPVPIYAWGPRAGDFAGTAYPNEMVGDLLLSYLSG